MKQALAVSSVDSTQSKVISGVDARAVGSSVDSDPPLMRQKSLESLLAPILPRVERFNLASHFLLYKQDRSLKVSTNQEKDQTFGHAIRRTKGDVRRASVAAFEGRYYPHEMISRIYEIALFSELVKPKKKDKPRDLLSDPTRRAKIVKLALDVCDGAEKLFKEEYRVLRISQPCVVFGDTHGNLADLLTMEEMFWKQYPSLDPRKFLFLGDYVDRGQFSFEVVSYLFAQKILAPGKFLLLRGNHEFRSVNKSFNFYGDLRDRFGEADGQLLYERFSKVFEWMPLAAVIDGKIFCAHGGVPSHYGEVCHMATLDNISAPLEDDNKSTGNSAPYRELVWNDPIDKHAFKDQTEGIGEQLDSMYLRTGFLPNTKRGTGKYWSETATKNFLSVNKMDFVIRAHEVAVNGFQLHHGGLVITVFSSSNYQNSNDAGAVIVQDWKLRPVKLIPGRIVPK